MAPKDFDLFGHSTEDRECIVGERVRIAFRGNGTVLQALGNRLYRILEDPIASFPLNDLDGDNCIINVHIGALREAWPRGT
jgi:hypothetical protein